MRVPDDVTFVAMAPESRPSLWSGTAASGAPGSRAAT
jgi:hypothetical protein